MFTGITYVELMMLLCCIKDNLVAMKSHDTGSNFFIILLCGNRGGNIWRKRSIPPTQACL